MTINTDDLSEDLIHSMQKHVEVDEPEPDEVPVLSAPGEEAAEEAAGDMPDAEKPMDRMTEEDLLRGLEGLPPLESSGSGRTGY